MKAWLIQSPKGELKGPASTREVAKAVHAGVVRPDQLVTAAEGGGGWQRIDSVPELKRELAALADEDVPTLAIDNPADDPMLQALLARTAHNSQPPENEVLQSTLIASPDELAALEATMVAKSPRTPSPPDIGGLVESALASASKIPVPSDPDFEDEVRTSVRAEANVAPVPPISDRLPPSVRPSPLSAAPVAVAGNAVPAPPPRSNITNLLFAFAIGLAGGLAALMVAYVLFADL